MTGQMWHQWDIPNATRLHNELKRIDNDDGYKDLKDLSLYIYILLYIYIQNISGKGPVDSDTLPHSEHILVRLVAKSLPRLCPGAAHLMDRFTGAVDLVLPGAHCPLRSESSWAAFWTCAS